ncbi:ABC transporter substrate-binding protein [Thauera humireducens]|uniref:ABC transporter substrate-binding protein n=1 Tax=Thauera humireducens TaxID=1134435 RepID=UPI00311E45DF
MFKTLKRLTLAAAGVLLATGLTHAADRPAEVRLDYAYYSPPSLVLKKFGWLEEDLKADGVPVKWVLSQGSNRALEFLNSGSVDFGSTAGLAAVLSKANGNPIKSVYVYSRPEWTALVVPKDSPIESVKDLKGKKVAATKGTDPSCSCCAACSRRGCPRPTSRSSRCSMPTGGSHWSRDASTRGPGSIH